MVASNTLADVMLALQREEDRILHMLSAVRSEFNKCAPVSKLPPEVLEQIFSLYAFWLESKYKPEYSIALTQVCRSWRYTAINTAEIWTHIDISNQPYARTFLKRSGIAPIHLISSARKGLCTTDDFQLPIERVKSIDIHLFSKLSVDFTRLLGPLARCSHLGGLKLTSDSDSRLNITPPPHLQRLALDFVSIPWKACSSLSDLTRLSLCRLEYGPSLIQLLLILEGSPRLEHIQLIGIKPAIDIFIPPPTRTIVLPDLRELTIDAEARATLALLSRIVQPSSIRSNTINDLIPTNDFTITSDDRLFPVNSITNLEAIHFRALHLETDVSRFFGSAMNATPTITTATPPPVDNPSESIFDLEFCWPILGSLLYVPPFFDLSNITTFDIGERSPHHLTDYILLLHRMPNLESLRLRSGRLPIVDILSILTETNVDSGFRFELSICTTPLCPRLQRITFDLHAKGDWQEYHGPLIGLVKARREATTCIPLQRLNFNLLDPIPPESYDELRNLVPKVTVCI